MSSSETVNDAEKPKRRKKKVATIDDEQAMREHARQVALDKKQNSPRRTPQHTLKVVAAGVKSLKPYRDNPRKGNVSAIAESLIQNGQYRPIVVRRSTREILAGNHTWQAATQIGWKKVDVVYVDVDDEEAARIVLADNRTNDLATYDSEALAKVLESLHGDPIGTGYSPADMDALVSVVAGDAVDDSVLDAIIRPEYVEDERDDEGLPSLTHVFDKTGHTPDAPDDPHTRDEEEPDDLINNQPQQLPGVLQLAEDLDWKGKTVTYWQIPKISTQNLVLPEDLPDNIRCYVPRLHRDWPDDDQGWMIISRSGNSAGLAQPDKSIFAFYTYDEYFSHWSWNFAAECTKLLNAGIRMAVSPNFSQYATRPMAENLNSIYRSRYVSRYMQEAGIKLIPDMQFTIGNRKFLDEYVMKTLPDRLPVVALQRHSGSAAFDEEMMDDYLADVEHFYNTKKPEVLILYAGETGYEQILGLGLPWEIRNVNLFSNVMHQYADAQKEREAIKLRKGIV